MSAPNPLESNLQALLPLQKRERKFPPQRSQAGFAASPGFAGDPGLAELADAGPQSRPETDQHQENALGESLLERILATTADIEQQITAGGLDFDGALRVLAERTLTLTCSAGVAIGLIDPGELVCRAAAGSAPDLGARVALDKGLSGECIRSSIIVRSDDTAKDDRLDPATCQALNLRSAIAVPICFSGSVIGVIEVFSAEPNAFDDWAALAMSHLAHFIAGITNATPVPPPMEVVPAAPTAPQRPLFVPRRNLHRSFEDLRPALRQLWGIACRHSRIALLLAAALATAAAAWYSVREMIRSKPPTHSSAEANLPTAPPLNVVEAPASPGPVPPDPAVGREDALPSVGATSTALEQAKTRRGSGPTASNSIQVRAEETSSSQPLPETIEQASGPERKPDVAPEPPALAVVQRATQPDTLIAPLMSVPAMNPALAAAHVAPTQEGSGKRGFVSRVMGKPKKLKGLVRKDQNKTGDKPGPQTSGPRPPAHAREN